MYKDKTINLKQLISSLLLGLIIFVGTIFLLSRVHSLQRFNGLAISTFLLNGLIIFYNLIKSSKSPYRLMDVMNIFMFIFMFVAPFIQYVTNSFPWWSEYLITDGTVIYTNVVVLLFTLFYNFFYSFTGNQNLQKHKIKYHSIKNIRLVLDLFFLATLIASLVVIVQVGFTNLFARSTYTLTIENQSLGLIIDTSFRSVSVIFVALNLLYRQKSGKLYKPLNFLIGLILMILVNFPTGSSRFWIASIYIGLMAILFKKNTPTNIFKIILLSGLLIIFPILNLFRNLTFSQVLQTGISLPSLTEFFLSGDFDAFSMLTRAITTVEEIGFSWGHQLLGALLFFIPRSIWPDKPVGSGSAIATLLGWDFTNVSMPLIGESYLNFGIIGVITLAMFMGVILKKADINYFRCVEKEPHKIYFVEIYFPFTLGLLFFIMRGDLLSSWAFYIGFMSPLVVLYLVNRFIREFIKFKNLNIKGE